VEINPITSIMNHPFLVEQKKKKKSKQKREKRVQYLTSEKGNPFANVGYLKLVLEQCTAWFYI